ncbi:MAG TPA: YwiC-like family protein, partial [Limnochorda sp.]
MRQASRPVEREAARQDNATFREALRLLVPREHGSWGMLLTVLILPHWVFDLSPAAFGLSGAALLLFLARQPAEVLFSRGRSSWEARAAWGWVTSLVAAGGLVALWTLVRAEAFTGPVILLGSLSAGLILAGTLWE